MARFLYFIPELIRMEKIAEPWDEAQEVTDYTDTDLQYSRSYSTRVRDPEFEIHRLTETVRQLFELDNWSDTLDTALRVEIADAIDNQRTWITRDQFDVAYMIPPRGWVEQENFTEQELVDESDIDTDDPYIGYSAPETTRTMMDKTIDEGLYETKTEVIVSGLRRILGHQ
jgi:hypothetical protein